MRTSRVLAGLLAGVTALALAGCAGNREQECGTDERGAIVCSPEQRSAAPALTGDLLDGSGTWDVTQERGNVVVLNFWGSWCAPCRAEADDLEAVHLATRDSGVRFMGINIQDSRDKAIAFEEGRVSYPSLFDPPSRLALAFDIAPNSIPATIVLDREGRVAVVIRGAVQQESFLPYVERVAAEAGAADGPD